MNTNILKEKVFKDAMNKWITSGLFKETAQRKTFIIYSLEEARKDFIACNDPTGYQYSNGFLGGYAHWVALKASPALEHHILAWEEELEVKLRSEALVNMYTLAKGDKGYQASKFLIDGGWKPKTSGRPTRDAVKKESAIKSKMYDEFKLKTVK